MAVLLVPVRLSALTAADVTPVRPMPITSPVDGVVGKILVSPNQPVRAGTALLEIDDTTTRNRLAVAQKTLDTAKADWARASGKAFSDDTSRTEIQLLDARIQERAAEVAFLNEQLARLRPTAPIDGIALFADAEEWRGRPIQTGERVMTVADPKQAGLTLYLAPEDALSLEVGAEVKMYLNVAPLTSYRATVTQTAYEPGLSPEGHPAYIVKAVFEPNQPIPRLGLKGTAKIYGEWTVLGYAILRKPLRALRQALAL
jgi:multidrug resistance efflux pump